MLNQMLGRERARQAVESHRGENAAEVEDSGDSAQEEGHEGGSHCCIILRMRDKLLWQAENQLKALLGSFVQLQVTIATKMIVCSVHHPTASLLQADN